jgi:hypothetical protein
MGISGLLSHSTGKKHIAVSNCAQSGAIFFKRTDSSSASATSSKSRTVESMVIPVSTLRAEVLWTLKVAESHYSLRSCLGLNNLFKSMFTDSEIAKCFQLSKTKCGYLINYGLAPHFKELLLQKVNGSQFFALSFDESMNKIFQEEQMDLQVRFWDESKKQVSTRYLDSEFLKRPNASP